MKTFNQLETVMKQTTISLQPIEFEEKRLEQLLLKTEDKSKQLEHQEKHEQEFHGVLSQEIITVTAEIERLTSEIDLLFILLNLRLLMHALFWFYFSFFDSSCA